MTQPYKFLGVECVIGRPPNERRLQSGDTIELTEEQYLEFKAAGAALVPVED